VSEPLPTRRVVTGHRADGTAIVLTDGPAPKVDRKPSGITSTLIWSSDATPVPLAAGTDIEDLGLRALGTEPPANGSRFCVNDFPPRQHALHAPHRHARLRDRTRR
jgi:hypothetical protein